MPPPLSFVVSAPGKVILFGEHAVVHEKVPSSSPPPSHHSLLLADRSQAAVATSVSLRSYLLVRVAPTAQPAHDTPRLTLNFPDIGLDHTWTRDQLPTPPHSSTPPATAPVALDVDILKSIEPLLEPFARKE